ncbi:MAG: N-acetylmuramoyl-L-alanine amidase-like domain-containing protein [Thermodesulfobacteriota bacterium]
MKQIIIIIIFLTLFFPTASKSSETNEQINLGKFTEKRIAELIKQSSTYNSNNQKIDFISEQFMGVPYLESTLIGNDKTEEVLTINLAGLDCFTYIDYVEAIRLSSKFDEFKSNIIKVRYKDGTISYPSRNHFFSDWANSDTSGIKDITKSIGGESVILANKYLNKKKDGTLYLTDIPVVKRQIAYIPSGKIDKSITDNLETGDYVGIYSDKDGLDVSHTGILIKKGNRLFLRHASSRSENRRVVDEELLNYLKNKPGIVVYRSL